MNELTPVELKTLECAAKGMSVKATAARMFLAEPTIKAYRQSVLVKLFAANMTEAVAIAMREGLIS